MSAVNGKSICLTGRFTGFKRKDAESRLATMGALIKSGVSKNVDILIAGTAAGSKLSKARSLGLEIRDEAWLQGIFDAAPATTAAAPAATTAAPAATAASPAASAGTSQLAGKVVVLTGKFQQMDRAEATRQVAALGATIGKSVTRKTTLLIVGERAGSKLAKARSLGIEVKDEAWLKALLDGKDLSQADAASADAKPTLEGPLSDWMDRFGALVRALQANKRVHVHRYWQAPPIVEADLKRIERKWGELAPSIRNLYRQANGLCLVWMAKDDPQFDAKRFSFKGNEPRFYDIEQCVIDSSHIIWLPPLEKILAGPKGFIDYAYDDTSGRVNRVYGREWKGNGLEKIIRAFDFPGFYYAVGWIMEKGVTDPPVVMGDDHGACWTDSRVTNFEDYMEFVLAHRGSLKARRSQYLCGSMRAEALRPEQRGRLHWEAHPIPLASQLPPPPKGGDIVKLIKKLVRAGRKKGVAPAGDIQRVVDEGLVHDNWKVKVEAVEALGWMGAAAVPHIDAILQAGSGQVQNKDRADALLRILAAGGALPDHAVRYCLRKVLIMNSSWPEALQRARQLAALGAHAEILSCVREGEPMQRSMALLALGFAGAREQIATIEGLIQDDVPAFRERYQGDPKNLAVEVSGDTEQAALEAAGTQLSWYWKVLDFEPLPADSGVSLRAWPKDKVNPRDFSGYAIEPGTAAAVALALIEPARAVHHLQALRRACHAFHSETFAVVAQALRGMPVDHLGPVVFDLVDQATNPALFDAATARELVVHIGAHAIPELLRAATGERRSKAPTLDLQIEALDLLAQCPLDDAQRAQARSLAEGLAAGDLNKGQIARLTDARTALG